MSEPAAVDEAAERRAGERRSAVSAKRRRLIGAVLAVFIVAGIGWGAWWVISGRWHESTDDAYVGGNLVQVNPQVAGTVIAIRADDTDFVKSGDTLVEPDKADARVALESSEAQLARTVRAVRNLRATSAGLDASVQMRRSDLEKAEQDLARRRQVETIGAVSGEEMQHARDAVEAAKAAYRAAQQQAQAQRALVEHTSIESHPDVQNAAAHVREAYLAYSRTSLPAPVSGIVARRSVQVGQRVNAGTPLMAIVPLEQVWVDANFKEGQLANLRAGQPVTLVADAYGGSVKFHGRVAGFGAGTGSAFSLLPAQNASGNWIKVVQRVPVRVAIDPAELKAHPLQLGLSMQVEVDTHERSGERLSNPPRPSGYETSAYGSVDRLADQRVGEIIAANSGERAGEKPRSGPVASLRHRPAAAHSGSEPTVDF
jgi:membrane fusion protein, multidrug efflux system